MEIAGYAASVLIGISLGLIGGGGSILTVPVLVYLFGIDPVPATAYSLFIVGATSLAGAWPKYKAGLIDLRTAAVFGIPSIIAVYATRQFIIPVIPQNIFNAGSFVVTKSLVIMLLFAALMIVASISMIREKNVIGETSDQPLQYNYPMILLEGTLVGMLTGLVGAGGGFLIIPALVLFSKLPMKKAVGTSLLIIGVKSLIGFTGDLAHFPMNWTLLATITVLAVAGLFAGNYTSKKVSAKGLQKGFGWFVLVMGCYIIIKELFL